jgi:bifunctional non-homologous end joining protein LigD
VYVDFLEANGKSVFEHACRMGLEGIVAKRVDAPYRSGRQDSWIKLKCTKSDTFPLVAFVEKLGARPRKIASLYVGRWERDRLIYAGKVRSGYTELAAREVRERLDPLIRKRSPLSVPVKKPKATWVEPVVKAEIEYSAVTDDGLLRAAVFKGLRDDLDGPRVRAPSVAASGKRHHGRPHVGVPRENILQLLPDAVVPTKEQLATYWGQGAQAGAQAPRASAAQTRAACAWNDLLPQGTITEGYSRLRPPTAHSQTRGWGGHALMGR